MKYLILLTIRCTGTGEDNDLMMERSAVTWLILGWLLMMNWTPVRAQTIPTVPFDVEFAGVTVHINEEARVLIQQEVNGLYANRPLLLRDLETLRQLTPLLEARLAEDRLPVDFRYAALPFTDQPEYGYWGLTIIDAGKLKLRIDPSVDERFHPVLSTDAVVDRLSELQLASGNYAQTLLYYLQGVSPTDRRPASKYATYLLLTEKNPSLLWKILARKFAYEREEPTFRPAKVYLVFDYPNGSGQTLDGIAKQLNLPVDRTEPFNQWLKTTVIPADKRYPVPMRVTAEEFPQVKSEARSQSRSGNSPPTDVGFPTLVKKPQQPTSIYSPAVYYTINGLPGVQAQPCDNVITLAYYGKMRVESFIADNDLTAQDVIHPGQIYYLDQKARRAKVPFHIVQRGQTLREVSNMYGVRLRSLLKFNRIPANQRVQTGRIVWLQRKRPRRRPVEYQQLTDAPVPADEPVVPTQRSASIADADTLTRAPGNTPVTPTNRPAIPPAPVRSVPTPTATRPSSATAAVVTRPARRAGKVSSDETAKGAAPRRDSAQAVAEPREVVRLHTVKAGQTYYSIARQYGIAVGQLYAWNNLAERYPLEIGQEIIVSVVKVPPSIVTQAATKPTIKTPVKTATSPRPPAQPIAAPKVESSTDYQGAYYYYFVQPGQTAYRIALLNKVSVEDLARWNNLKNYSIEIGQRLVIRKK